MCHFNIDENETGHFVELCKSEDIMQRFIWSKENKN